MSLHAGCMCKPSASRRAFILSHTGQAAVISLSQKKTPAHCQFGDTLRFLCTGFLAPTACSTTAFTNPAGFPTQTGAGVPKIATPDAFWEPHAAYLSLCVLSMHHVYFVQISHTFFDAPGAQAAVFVEGKEADPASQSKPYVTMVFCGPADYKVTPHPTPPPPSPTHSPALTLLALCSAGQSCKQFHETFRAGCIIDSCMGRLRRQRLQHAVVATAKRFFFTCLAYSMKTSNQALLIAYVYEL